MTQLESTTPEPTTTDCLFSTIVGFLLPFFLTGAAGNPQIARRPPSRN